MVVFVLNHTGINAIESFFVFHKVFILPAQANGIGAFHIPADMGDTQAAFFIIPGLTILMGDDLRSVPFYTNHLGKINI
jgi:hypothetical protein